MANNDRKKSTFETLEIWQGGRELRREISELTKNFPNVEKYRLTDQMIRASRSVTANIAEGYGRYHYQENIQFCRTSRGSLYELIDHFITAFDENYIDEVECNLYKEKIDILIAKTNGYIAYLKKRKNED
ncbi:MAG TPA: four helix bundle protein [Ignavibacteria bacterium]|nr:four helix bundle protein [Ignavibacteria bacterium]HRF66347.1 four helix bundle protein [Ignavibacteria bacterium]HRJ04325.1 four helix bundle protein [Ignavibacteria bacterium]